MKTLTVEDYKAAGDEFWPKYWYISKELGDTLFPYTTLFRSRKSVV